LTRPPPTDFQLLREIYERHREDFGSYSDAVHRRTSKIMVPIDIPAIADRFGVDPDSIFGRMYYHLDVKYGEALPGRPRKFFFTPRAGDDENCVNFPLLEAVLAGLWEERNRNLRAVWISILSIGIALASLLISFLT
jgi:hypothetical protein